MIDPGTSDRNERSRTQASARAISALFKLLGWVTLGIGFGFAVTLFTFTANAQTDTDRMISLAGGLLTIMLTILIFVLTYGFAETFRMLLQMEDECDTISKRISEVADRIEIVPEEPLDEPKVEEIVQPPADEASGEQTA